MNTDRLDEMPDEEILPLARAGDDKALEYLLNKYKNFVKTKSRNYFLVGADHEDIVQEGMIGLYKAIRDYQPERLASFRSFAELCVTRQIITAIKTATRQKHMPLNSYISLDKPKFEEDNDRTMMENATSDPKADPENMMIYREELTDVHERIAGMLTPLEQRVLEAYMDGQSYQQMSEEMHRQTKSIDNALQRVKRKLAKYLEEKT